MPPPPSSKEEGLEGKMHVAHNFVFLSWCFLFHNISFVPKNMLMNAVLLFCLRAKGDQSHGMN